MSKYIEFEYIDGINSYLKKENGITYEIDTFACVIKMFHAGKKLKEFKYSNDGLEYINFVNVDIYIDDKTRKFSNSNNSTELSYSPIYKQIMLNSFCTYYSDVITI